MCLLYVDHMTLAPEDLLEDKCADHVYGLNAKGAPFRPSCE